MRKFERFRTVVLALLVTLVVLIAPSTVGLLVMLTLVVGLVSRLLVDRVHRLVTSETLEHRADQVNGLGCRRGVVVVLAWSASASSSAAARLQQYKWSESQMENSTQSEVGSSSKLSGQKKTRTTIYVVRNEG